MAKDKTKVKKTKVKKIANVAQRVVVNVQPASSRPRSKNTRSFTNNGFQQYQAQSRIMNELSNMPNAIKQIVSERRDVTSSIMEERFRQISVAQELMNRQILGRVEKQTLDKYLENIASGLSMNVKDLKSGGQDFPTGTPIP
jgi:vesicle coat complex subunit